MPTTTTRIAKHIPQLACCAFRYNISSCCCSLFLLYLIKICCCQSFGQQAGGEQEETEEEEVAGEWKERYAHTQTHKNVVSFGAHKFQLIAFCI